MSVYSCPDCKDGELVATIRELELEDGETAQVLEDGRVVATKVGCNNGCSSENAPPRRRRVRRTRLHETARPRGTPPKKSRRR